MIKRPLAWTLGLLAAAAAALGTLRAVPLDDDWNYLLDVRHLLLGGVLRLVDFGAPTLVAHVGWGAAFSAVLGLGPAALRVSTLALAALALIALDRLAARGGADGPAALSPSFGLLACPLFFALSFTYMTDVPSIAWTLAAVLAYRRALDTDRDVWWLAGSTAAAWAYLIRQTGGLTPLAPLMALALERRLDARRVALVLAPVGLAAAAHGWWFGHVHGPTWASTVYVRRGTWEHLSRPLAFLWDAERRSAGMLLEVSLFTAPWLAALTLDSGVKKPSARAALALLALAAPAIVVDGGFPYLSHVITPRGLGALSISDPEFKAAGALGSPAFLKLMTAASLACALGWLGRAKELATALRDRSALLLALAGGLQAGAALIGPKCFDRYALPLMPGALLVAWRAAGAGTRSPRRSRTASALCAALLLWSALGTWDWLAASGAAWSAAQSAVDAGVTAPRIFAGLEWTGFHDYEDSMAALKAQKPLAEIGEWEWFTRLPVAAEASFRPPSPTTGRLLQSSGYVTPLSAAGGRVYLYERPGP